MHRSVSGGLVRASVFGANDGLVSNVSLLVGFAGGGASADVVRLAGLAGAIAGSMSMAVGEWISVSSQNELVAREVEIERRELLHNAASETAELAGMYESHGMSPTHAIAAAEEVMQNAESALVVHTREELGVDPGELPSPWQAAVSSFVCFLVGALLPVIPWLFDATGNAPEVATLLIGGVGAALLGVFIGRLADRNIAWTATRQVLIVAGACAVTYAVGSLVGVNVT